MIDRRPVRSARRRWAERLIAGSIGAFIGFFIVLWQGGSILLAVLLGCGLGFLIGLRVATSRRWKGGDRPESPYHASLGKVGRGGGGDMEPPSG